MFQEDGKLRFIEGVETEGTSVHDGSYEVKQDVLVNKFKKFVREFAYHTHANQTDVMTLKYREQFKANCDDRNYRLEVPRLLSPAAALGSLGSGASSGTARAAVVVLAAVSAFQTGIGEELS
ncbi:Hypothetical protein SCF082_LOCUS45333 [Durusdinium trenchii]|uniref:Uncharacterized protein n=1 Tax=Durusdinium trenchii TaxID=1381693 RepID=A0ABP0RBR1_9DINO